jgi:hypothetical protein
MMRRRAGGGLLISLLPGQFLVSRSQTQPRSSELFIADRFSPCLRLVFLD